MAQNSQANEAGPKQMDMEAASSFMSSPHTQRGISNPSQSLKLWAHNRFPLMAHQGRDASEVGPPLKSAFLLEDSSGVPWMSPRELLRRSLKFQIKPSKKKALFKSHMRPMVYIILRKSLEGSLEGDRKTKEQQRRKNHPGVGIKFIGSGVAMQTSTAPQNPTPCGCS